MGGETKLKRVLFEYEDGTVIAYDETQDYIIGNTFVKTIIDNKKLTSHILKSSSPLNVVRENLRKLFHIWR